MAGTDLDVDRHRRWWQLVRVLQWLLLAAVVGRAGLAGRGVRARLPAAAAAARGDLVGLPAPTVLMVGGVLAGLLLAGLSRIGVEVGARAASGRPGGLLRGHRRSPPRTWSSRSAPSWTATTGPGPR